MWKEEIVMASSKLPVNWSACVSCKYWKGNRKLDAFGNYLEFDPKEKGKCEGTFKTASFLGTQAKCSGYEQAFKK